MPHNAPSTVGGFAAPWGPAVRISTSSRMGGTGQATCPDNEKPHPINKSSTWSEGFGEEAILNQKANFGLFSLSFGFRVIEIISIFICTFGLLTADIVPNLLFL